MACGDFTSTSSSQMNSHSASVRSIMAHSKEFLATVTPRLIDSSIMTDACSRLYALAYSAWCNRSLPSLKTNTGQLGGTWEATDRKHLDRKSTRLNSSHLGI